MRFSGFPRVGHLPGSSHTPEDVLLTDDEARSFLDERLYVFEKLDGLNVSLRRTGEHRVEVGLKLEWARALDGGVGRAVDLWARQNERKLLALLARGDTLYGEWVWHRVSVFYDRLPDVFVGFALDRVDTGFLPFDDVTRALDAAGLAAATPRWRGVPKTVARIRKLVGRSGYGPEPMEGVILERQDGGWPRWAKWVEPGYDHPVPGRISGQKNRVTLR